MRPLGSRAGTEAYGVRRGSGIPGDRGDTVPAIAVPVHAFLASRQPRRRVSFHLDVGGGTLDAVAFKRWEEDGEPQVNFRCGKVDPPVTDALAEAASGRLERELDAESVR